MSSPPSSPRGTRPPASPRPSSPRGPKAAPSSPRSPRAGPQPRKAASSTNPAPARPRPAGARPPLPPGSKPPLAPGGEDALAEMRPSQQNGEAVGSRPGSGAASPAKADSHEGTPVAKRKSKAGESRVRVFVRVRPAVRKNELDANEGDKGSTSAIHCQGPKLWLLEDGLSGDKGGKGGQDAKTRQFVFDGSLTPDSTQEDVYRCAISHCTLRCLAHAGPHAGRTRVPSPLHAHVYMRAASPPPPPPPVHLQSPSVPLPRAVCVCSPRAGWRARRRTSCPLCLKASTAASCATGRPARARRTRWPTTSAGRRAS